MTHHWDYSDKTKSERRERGREKKKERMGQGKKAKLWAQIIQDRAEEAKRLEDIRIAEEAKGPKGSRKYSPPHS